MTREQCGAPPLVHNDETGSPWRLEASCSARSCLSFLKILNRIDGK